MKTQIIAHVIGIEGGFSDHANDPGGATRYGITEQVARAHGYTGEMSRLPAEIAVEIYSKKYWDTLNLDDVLLLSPSIAFELFDSGVNAGVGRAGCWLQDTLNRFNRQARDYEDIPVDGDVGPRTIAALQALINKRGTTGKKIVWRALNCLQGAHYMELPQKFEDFKVGWLSHRVGELPPFIQEGE
ncbi:MAG: hypothetical protein OXR68_01205 [Alphaproteobacteria bacterium]|nr:hypothetical protein [Alphaproteobacteria bacterium]MDD9919228.1 hypothetical protein [Alphaproteobacteria bacterium]